jgi:uncharacterized protein
MSTTVGVISDTHGLLRPEALAALQGSERIIHAGDVGREGILLALERIAPVTAVRGNVDTEAWTQRLPMTELVEIAGVKMYVIHIVEDLDVDPAAMGVSVVISGHSHRPGIVEKSGVTYLNPGSAGASRFHLPVTVAKVFIEDGRANAEIIEIAQAGD